MAKIKSTVRSRFWKLLEYYYQNLLKKIKQIKTTLHLVPNTIGEIISNKLQNVLRKNNVFKILKNISAILDDEEKTSRNDIPEDLNLNDSFQICLILLLWTLNETFLHIKTLSDHRHRLFFENLKNYLIVQCNNMCTGNRYENNINYFSINCII